MRYGCNANLFCYLSYNSKFPIQKPLFLGYYFTNFAAFGCQFTFERRKKGMKTRLMKAITGLCTLALALTPFFYSNTVSIVFFGEPEYPCKKNDAE